ncbi:hypothetical protein AJ80_01761 [Polytolypa hystricis UAMH7299]|uniref:Ribosomal protein/NADH dehydrogenase domain-containing protein n=1 Tax=Polytolypa hystricis (strain UAMH7299) TaxID=1447883 RepID=A0A2B7Z0M6_POLH7|nr:hypothetical protein AJ80_01761 [Polytolypa hystricis UAMH7299]
MPSILKRMRKLKSLLDIRTGLGAAILPSPTGNISNFRPVTRLHLTYARKMYDGHMGARKFWRECLPRLKFHNPAIPMTVNQTEDQAGPALLSVYFDKTANVESVTPSATAAVNAANEAATAAKKAKKNETVVVSDSAAPQPAENENVTVINVKDRQLEDIWSEFRKLTGAVVVEATKSEMEDKNTLMEEDRQSDRDRKRVALQLQKSKDQAKLLQEARDAVQKLRDEQ